MEIFLAFLTNLKYISKVLSIVTTASYFAAVVFCLIISNPDTLQFDGVSQNLKLASTSSFGEIFKKAKLHRLWVIPIILGLFSTIPSIDDLWRVRIALIKLQLSKTENIESSSKAIERIAKKLECKYLGGCEEEAK